MPMSMPVNAPWPMVVYQGKPVNHYIVSPTRQIKHYGYGSRGVKIKVHPEDVIKQPTIFVPIDDENARLVWPNYPEGAPASVVLALGLPKNAQPVEVPLKSPAKDPSAPPVALGGSLYAPGGPLHDPSGPPYDDSVNRPVNVYVETGLPVATPDQNQEILKGDSESLPFGDPVVDQGNNLPDPSQMTVAEIRELSLSADGWRALLVAEQNGPNRVTAITYIKEMLEV